MTMKKNNRYPVLACAVVCSAWMGASGEVFAEDAVEEALGQSDAGGQRIDFDERLVQGQTAKAGSVVMFYRRSLPHTSLMRTQRKFSKNTIAEVFHWAWQP